VPASRGLAWLVDGLGALRQRPGPYFGACFLVGLLVTMPVAGLVFGLMMPIFSAGLVSLLRTRAQGSAGLAGQAFDGFREPGAVARLLPLVMFNIAWLATVIGVLVVVAGPQLVVLGEAVQAGKEPTPEQSVAVVSALALPLLVLAPVAFFVNWVMLLAVPRAMLDRVPGAQALAEAAAGVWRNLGAFVLNALGTMAVMAGLVAVLLVPLLVVTAVREVAPALGLLLQVPLAATIAGSVQGLTATQMYRASREIFDADTDADAAAPAQIEV
jgi:hypothetical protein